MAHEQEIIFKEYTVTIVALKTALGIPADETVALLDLQLSTIEVKTTKDLNPTTKQSRTYRISYPDARTLLGMVDAENFLDVTLDDPNVRIQTQRQTR